MNVSNKVFALLDRATRHPSSPSYCENVLSILNDVLAEMQKCDEVEPDVDIDLEGYFLRFDENRSLAMFFAAFLTDGRPIVLRFDHWFVDAFIAESRSGILEAVKGLRASDAALTAIGGYLDDPTKETPVLLCFDADRPLDSFRQIFCAGTHGLALEEKRHVGVLDRRKAFFEPGEIFAGLGLDLELKEKPEGRYHCIRRIYRPFRREDHPRLPRIFGGRSPVPGHIFISLEAEKRSWREQEEALSGFLSAIRAELGEALRVVVNGMTAPLEGGVPATFDVIDKREIEIIRMLEERVPSDTVFERTFGQTVKEKMEAARTCSFFVGPSGTAGIVPIVLGMPGIVYNNRSFINLLRPVDPPGTVRIAEDRIEDLPELSGVAPKFTKEQSMGYGIDAAHFIETALRQFHKVVRAPVA